MMLTRMLVNVSHNVTNMMVLQPVNRGAAVLLTVNHVRLTQDAQVMRGQRLRNAQAGVQLAHAVRAVHQVVRNGQAQRIRERREDCHGRAELLLPVFGAAPLEERRRGGRLVRLRGVVGVVGVSFGGIFVVVFVVASHSIFTLCTGAGHVKEVTPARRAFLTCPSPLCALILLVRPASG